MQSERKTGTIDAEDLARLTGTPLKNRQKECLRQNGICYIEDVKGKPKLTWESLNMQIVGIEKVTEIRADDGFNIEGM